MWGNGAVERVTIDVKKLVNLDYTAYEHAKDFGERLEQAGLQYVEITVQYHYDGGVPVFDVRADDPVGGRTCVNSYRLEDVTEEEFEAVMYRVWKDAFMELEY